MKMMRKHLEVPKSLRGKRKTMSKRRRARTNKQTLKKYQRQLDIQTTRVEDPQTTKEICQDSMGILEEISEHGFNDQRYLELSNHLMTIHKKSEKSSYSPRPIEPTIRDYSQEETINGWSHIYDFYGSDSDIVD